MEPDPVTGGRRLSAARRRAQIEQVGGRLFGERGYQATTVGEIAAACGVTKPIVYSHFESKKALYLALLARHAEEMPRFFDRVPADRPLRERFEAILDGWLSYVQSHGYAWQMLFRDSTGDEEIHRYRDEVRERARAVLAMFIASQAEAGVARDEVEPLAEFVRAGGVGLALYAVDHPEVPRGVLLGVGMRVFDGLVVTGE